MIKLNGKHGTVTILFCPMTEPEKTHLWQIRFVDEDGIDLDARWLPPRYDLPHSGFVLDDGYMFVWHCQNELNHPSKQAAIGCLLYHACLGNRKPPDFVRDLAALLQTED